MSLSTLRTTYGQEDLERLANAPHKIYGLYERLGQYQPVLSGCETSSPDFMKGQQKPGYVEGHIDSGFGDDNEMSDEPISLPVNGEPIKPKLITEDSENQDSGLGPENMDTSDDEDPTEKDCAVTVARSPTPPKVTSVAPFRKPRTNHLQKMPSLSRRTNTTTTLSVSTSNTDSRTTSVTASEDRYKLRRNERSSAPWQPEDLDLLGVRKYLPYFIPNKDGDT